MPTTFSGTTNTRVTYTIADAPAIGSISDGAELKTTRRIENGTAANQANVGWREQATIPAGTTYTLELDNLGATAFGFAGTVIFSTLKDFYLINTATAAGRHVLVGTVGPSDSTAYSAKIGAGGEYRVADYLVGWPVVNNTSDTIHIANPTAYPITVELVLLGVGSIVES